MSGLDPALLIVGLLILLSVSAGWFSADEVVIHQQASRLSEAGEWTLQSNLAAEAVDADHEFALLARSGRVGDEIVAYKRHPLNPVLFSLAYPLPGRALKYLPNLLATVGACLLLSRRFQWSRVAFWLPVLGTPLIFHATVYWAHAMAFVLSLVVVSVLDDRDLNRFGRAFPFAAMFVMVLLRTEALLLAIAIFLAGMALHRTRSRAQVLSTAAPLAGAIAGIVFESALADWLFASPSLGNSTLGSSSVTFTVQGRIDVVLTLLFTPSVSGSGATPRIIGALLLIASVTFWRLGRGSDRTRSVLAICGALAFAVAALGAPAPGMVIAMPLLVVLFIGTKKFSPGGRRMLLAFVLFFGAVAATSYDNVGGGDWGARYLFIGVPLILVAVFPSVVDLWERQRPLLLAGLVAAAAIQVGVVAEVLDRRSTIETVDAVLASVESERAGLNDDVVVVSDERLARLLYDRGLRGAAFHVPPDQQERFETLHDASEVVWVDLESQSDLRDGRIVATVGSVVIRTEVRR